VRFERRIVLDGEHAIQDLVLRHRALVDLCNWVYVWMYWPFVVDGLVILFVVDPVRYRLARNAIFLGFDRHGELRNHPGRAASDHARLRRHRQRGGTPALRCQRAALGNRYTALPSFHAGWTMAMSLVLASSCTSRGLRVLGSRPACS
jgi:hypothetical protein